MALIDEITKRRTFAVIAHPDAGKTTLTEKLLLFGGAIHVAGAVKSNKIKKISTLVSLNNWTSWLLTEFLWQHLHTD